VASLDEWRDNKGRGSQLGMPHGGERGGGGGGGSAVGTDPTLAGTGGVSHAGAG
jgi:hypothetical protein